MIESQEECGSERGLTMHDEQFSSGRENTLDFYCHLVADVVIFFYILLLFFIGTFDIKHMNSHVYALYISVE